MLANDLDVSEWVYGIIHGEPVPSGDFLRAFADAVVRADAECYAALVPAARRIMQRFPKYKCSCQEWKAARVGYAGNFIHHETESAAHERAALAACTWKVELFECSRIAYEDSTTRSLPLHLEELENEGWAVMSVCPIHDSPAVLIACRKEDWVRLKGPR